MSLVRVRGGSKQQKTIHVITPEEFNHAVRFVREPFHTMALLAGCLGLRVCEIVGLQWADFDFDELTLLVQRSIVHGRVGDVKTEYSRDHVPLDPALAAITLAHRDHCYPTPEGWLFANPETGKPYHQKEIQKRHLRRAGKTAGFGFNLGWHTFRHSYRSWLDDSGATMTVQQKLMRHASIVTTMNTYGKAMSATKKAAHGKVVRMVLHAQSGRMNEAGSRNRGGR
jgi:integrase